MTSSRVLLLLFLSAFLAGAGSAATSGSFVPSTPVSAEYPSGLPIPTAADASTSKQFASVYSRWMDRAILGSYREAHPGESKGLDIIAKGCDYLRLGDDQLRREISVAAEPLEQSGIDDPVFFLIAGVGHDNQTQKEHFLKLAIVGFPKTNYPRFLLYLAAANLSKSLSDRKAPAAEVAAADQTAFDALRAGLTDSSFRPDEMPALRWRLDSPSNYSLLRRRGADMIPIFEQAVHVPEWIREYGLGLCYRFVAWEARTGDWASEVTEKGWEGWDNNLAKAREHFTKSWELNPGDPAAAAAMIEVAMGNGDNKKAEMRQWFDRAVAAQMDYYDAYRALMWGLRPRWHGSHEEMLQLGDECLQTKRFDTCVPNYYFEVVKDIASELSDPRAIYDRPQILNNLKLALDVYFATPDMPLVASYGHTMAAVLNYRNGNLAAARNHMAAIQFHPNYNLGRGLTEDIAAMMKAISAQ